MLTIEDLTDVVDLYGDPSQPDWTALEHGGHRATIRQLRAWMGSAAAALATGSDEVVAISSPNAVEHTVAFLGTLACGRRPLLIDPKHPDAVVADAVRRSGATTVIGRDVPGVARTAFAELAERPPIDRVRVPRDRVGSLLMTSGSTGAPKVVVRSRGADLAAAHNFRMARFPIAPGDRFWLSAPYTGSPFPGIVWGVLVARATVVFGAFGDADLAAFLDQERITGTFLGPTATRLAHARDGLRGPGWDRLRAILSGGDRLDAATAELMFERWPNAVFLGYGMTEVTQVALAAEDELRARPGTVGRALPLHQVRIAEVGGEETLPVGEEGEVLVRGTDMFDGYLGEPPAPGWYRTGDLGRVDAAGYLFITGRASSIVQVGGNRVSTEDVAGRLRAHPAIANAAVVAVDDPTWTTRLVAFVAPRADSSLGADELDRWLREQAAPYQVPRAYRFLAELPTESAGKISLRRLRELAESDAELNPAAASPRSAPAAPS